MLNRLLSAALAGCLFLLFGSPAFAYYSRESYEGDVTFTGMVEIPDGTPDIMIKPSYINVQLLYLAGPLQAAPRKSAAKSNEKIEILGKERDSKTGKLYVRYRYAGTFVLDNALQDVVKIRLPLHPESIWESSGDECFASATPIAWPTSGIRWPRAARWSKASTTSRRRCYRQKVRQHRQYRARL